MAAALWAAHFATCEGARIFGEFLLNLRGGLPPAHAEELPPTDKKGSTWTEEERQSLVRGQRRTLALGWLSVEDTDGAEYHPHRITDVSTGSRISPAQAQTLLTNILHRKGVTQKGDLDAWWDDCRSALTASIRKDAVWVNRAAAFDAMPQGPTPDQAKAIVMYLYGNDFARLSLPENFTSRDRADLDDESDDEPDEPAGASGDEPKDPSQKSRQIFSDLFGTNPEAKKKRGAGKEAFALSLGKFLRTAWDGHADLRTALLAWRRTEKQPELSEQKGERFPPEVKSSGSPSTTARRYRKLLVALGAWPRDGDEDGAATPPCYKSLEKLLRDELKRGEPGATPRFLVTPLADVTSAVKTRGEKPNQAIAHLVSTQQDAWKQHALVSYVLESCPNTSDPARTETTDTRVLAPKWADSIRAELTSVTGLKFTDKSATEFFRLMLALAARRFSQTHSWMKRNEAERHRAAQDEEHATEVLERLDPRDQARMWLETYETARAKRGGANEGFRIRPRALSGFEDVLTKWNTRQSITEREQAVAEVQESAEKFGDHDLFLALARDDAAVVWHDPARNPTADILKAWVKVRQAQFDQSRFLIPRYCHPDPFLHPAFCEFGGNSKPSVAYAWRGDRPQKRAPGGDLDRERCVWLLLPSSDGGLVTHQPIRWRSKRLWRDLGRHGAQSSPELARNDRLGRAAVGLPSTSPDGQPVPYRPAYPFSDDSKGWNARLQANREQLESLARLWNAQGLTWKDNRKALCRLRWFLTFSPDLATTGGPWSTYAREHGLNVNPNSAPNKKINEGRGSLAKHHLSRLSGLRILAVDLGHRYAAACAIWETLTGDEIRTACARSGVPEPGADDLFLHLEHNNKTTVYRRIAADEDPLAKRGGVPHPAPWARLDRQFLIKLQGEDTQARLAGPGERRRVEEFEREVRFTRPSRRKSADTRVDRLMADTVRIADLALRRHAERARIAFGFITTKLLLPGGKASPIRDDTEAHATLLEHTLLAWARLAVSARWHDDWARTCWNECVVGKLCGPHLPELTEEATRSERKEWEEQLRQELASVAKQLHQNESLRMKLHVLWATRWREDDGKPTEVDKATGSCRTPGTGWYARLRWLRDWIILGACEGKAESHRRARKASIEQLISLRNVGGLSLTRIAAFKSLYQLQKSFRMRPEPDDVRKNVPARDDDSMTNFGATTLRAMERMRENRVKQLASRIAAAALGLGKDLQLHSGDPRFASCHAVVIENLQRYRPDELQTRRENRQLMSWSSAKVRKFLKEACELAGLHLREVSAAYTSRQDSRTGAPGVRCQDVPVSEFLSPSGYWHTQIARARKKAEEGKGDARDRYLLDLVAHWSQVPESQRVNRCVRVPQRGGELFASVAPPGTSENHTPRRGAPGLQADLNAAANIGLKALLDPDWPGKWWSVPCSPDGNPVQEKIAGSAVFEDVGRLSTAAAKDVTESPVRDKSPSSIVNLWRDVTAQPAAAGHWRVFKAYWNDVQARVVANLRAYVVIAPSPSPQPVLDGGQTPF